MWQLASSTSVSCGGEKRERYLTDFSEEVEQPRKRRGPPTLVTDHQIFVWREEWVQVFEALWGEIGLELKRCRKEIDIARALDPLNKVHFIEERASVFFQESKGPVSPSAVKKARANLLNVQRALRDAGDSKRRALELLERINAALDKARSSERRIIKRAQKAQRKKASRDIKECRALSPSLNKSQDQLRALEAGFARQEILRFCRSKRYELTPVSLANAIAGLPYMGWRQSMRRCIKRPSANANGLDYQVFKVIRYISKSAKRDSAETLITEFRKSIPGLPNRYRAPRDVLANQWYFLERSIHLAFKDRPRSIALPFEIAKHYFRRLRSPLSQVDLILAEQAKLRLRRK